MTPAEILEHVLLHSCLRCINWHNGKGYARGCGRFDKCKSGRPLTSYPPMFRRRPNK